MKNTKWYPKNRGAPMKAELIFIRKKPVPYK